MNNKKGFTLVELLAVIAILAILVIIALPNVIRMYTDAKKNSFVTEAQSLAKNVASKFMSENMKGNHIKVISNKENSLDMSGEKLEYNFELDNNGKIKNMFISNGTYCVSTNKDYTQITKEDISEECSYEELHNLAGTLMNKFYEKLERTDRGLVSSIEFFSDGVPKEGATSIVDVSEAQNGSIKMYVMQSDENSSLIDLKIVGKGKISFPEDSTQLLAFYHYSACSGPQTNLKKIIFNNSIDTLRTTNMKKMFEYDYKLEELDLSGFDTSNVTNMSYMFRSAKVNVLDVSNFDTSNVTNMSYMFMGSQASEINGLTSFNTSRVADMSYMFQNAYATMLDVSNFDTSNVTNMVNMFSNSLATEIKGLSNFKTSKVTDMSNMFYYSHANSLNLNGFDTSNVTTMRSMFDNSAATEIKGLTSFKTSKVTDMSYMFHKHQAKSLDLSSFDTSHVTTMSYMLCGGTATEIKGLTNFNTSKVTKMDAMLASTKVKTLDVSSFDTSKVTTMNYMFGNSHATEIKGLENFNTSNVSIMSLMFYATVMNTLDVSNFDTSNVTNMGYMFKSCLAKEIKGLTNFNTSKATSMEGMFESTQVKSLDLLSFDTSNVTTMYGMFKGSQATEIKGLTNFKTSKVTSMGSMFEYSKMKSLDLSSFDTSKVVQSRMNSMFKNSVATTGYARTQSDAAKFNATSNKPSGLTFTVK